MKVINPNFVLDEENNIFRIRENEFGSLESTIREMLKPAEALGFSVPEFGIRDSRFSSRDLARTVKQKLVIKLAKGEHVLDLSMDIPKLIDGNYIIINGKQKIPQFQLFDVPIVTRGKNIKIRTNVATVVVVPKKEEPYIHITFLGKMVPLSLMLFAYFGIEEVNRKFNLSSQTPADTIPTNMYDKLISDLTMFYAESDGYTQDDFIKEVGRIYSQYNSKSKGEDVMYALDLIMETDTISKKLFITDTILDEVVYAIEHPDDFDDTDFINKRIRCYEYILLSKISKYIFDLCMSNRTARQPKFNVNSTKILSECNVSDIVQFDFSINPVEELTRLSRTSLIGPGGFKRENVPEHLRDISNSMFGRVCSVDTPDRDNCGILQNLVPNVKLDENLKFTDEILEKQPISIPVAMVPFSEHDDQTRLQMASSQMRQSVLTKSFDSPDVYSGSEWLYSKETQFLKAAKKDGEVVYTDDNYIIVVYDDNEVDIINVSYRKIYVGNMDWMKIYVKQGDKVKKNDILAESMFMNDGKINFGRKLLTAVIPYFGYNYEDGIVISDRIVEDDVFTSMHYVDLSFTIPPNKVLLSLSNDGEYKPLPEVKDPGGGKPIIHDRIGVGKPYAIMKDINSGIHCYSVFDEEIKLTAKKQVLISEVNIYPNTWNTEMPQYDKWVKDKIESQKKKQKDFLKMLKDYIPKSQMSKIIREEGLNKFSQVGKYRYKREEINGIHIEMYGIFERKINPGDKIANRHGNKGVISKIMPREKMPKLPDGRHVDICINPLGIISRMNIGQIFELHLSMSVNDLRQKMLESLKNGGKREDLINYFLGYIKCIDNTENNWYTTQMVEKLKDIEIDEDFINNIFVIQPPFESVTLEMLDQAMQYTNTDYDYKLLDPMSKSEIFNDIAVGYIYFFKMVHIAENRLAARGIGSYSRKTLQPLGGRRNKGGQRSGEMEMACLIGHDAATNLNEFTTTKSDCIDRKNRYIRAEIESTEFDPDKDDDGCNIAESVLLFESSLICVGLDPKD